MDSSDDDQDFPDDTDDGEFVSVTRDLFSDASFATPTECLLDVKRRHGVDFGYEAILRYLTQLCFKHKDSYHSTPPHRAIVREHRLDCFSFFKLINFIRSTAPEPSDVEKAVRDGTLDDEKYLKPVVEDDPLLQLGMDIDDGCFMNGDGDVSRSSKGEALLDSGGVE